MIAERCSKCLWGRAGSAGRGGGGWRGVWGVGRGALGWARSSAGRLRGVYGQEVGLTYSDRVGDVATGAVTSVVRDGERASVVSHDGARPLVPTGASDRRGRARGGLRGGLAPPFSFALRSLARGEVTGTSVDAARVPMAGNWVLLSECQRVSSDAAIAP